MRWAPLLLCSAGFVSGQTADFTKWNLTQARSVASAARVSGRVGGGGIRGLHTERAVDYKLRATWLTPEAIRACARLEQLSKSLSDEDTLNLVTRAEAAGDTVIMVELDPNEGSGVIPTDWSATLSPYAPKDVRARTVTGVLTPGLSSVRGLSGGARRDYNYDVFWLVFPLHGEDGKSLFDSGSSEAELTVHIFNKVGRVRWTIPQSMRERSR